MVWSLQEASSNLGLVGKGVGRCSRARDSKFDATVNEVEGVEVRGYPTLKFYPKGDAKKVAVDFDGERDLESIKAWLKENSANYKKHLESKSEL